MGSQKSLVKNGHTILRSLPCDVHRVRMLADEGTQRVVVDRGGQKGGVGVRCGDKEDATGVCHQKVSLCCCAYKKGLLALE